MLAPDLFFNLAMIVVDILAARWARRRAAAAPAPPGYFMPLLLGSLPLALAVATALLWGHRAFAVMRFTGHVLFGHLPLLLAWAAWRLPLGRRIRFGLAAAAATLVAVYLHAYWIEPTWIEITHHRYTHARLAGLTRPVKLVQIADIQTDQVGAFEERVLAEVARLEPDLVVMLGDYLHTWTREEYDREAAVLRELFTRSGIAPRLGWFAVDGDSDHVSDWKQVFTGLPVELLEDRCRVLELPGCRVNVIGVSQGRCRARSFDELAPATRGRDPAALDLYLAHAPDFVETLPADRPFLALAGHTHGGQVQLPWIGPLVTLSRLPRRFADDFLPFGAGHLSVTRGIGLEREDAPRLRFLCRPEIRVITLEPP